MLAMLAQVPKCQSLLIDEDLWLPGNGKYKLMLQHMLSSYFPRNTTAEKLLHLFTV